MQTTPDSPDREHQKVQVRVSQLLVEPGKSKRLAAMHKKTHDLLPPEHALRTLEKETVASLKPEVAAELNKARELINDKIRVIMNSYPPGRQNKLFSFRFGSVDEIKSTPVKEAFNRLGIDKNQVKMKLLAGLDYYGNDTHDDHN